MDKLYSKASLFVKAAVCFMLTPLFFAITYALNSELLLFYFILSAIPVGCLYTIPFWISVSFVRKYKVGNIKRYIFLDIISCYLPAVFGSLVTEVIDSVIRQSTEMAGLITVMFSIILLLITLIFWLMYLLYSRNK